MPKSFIKKKVNLEGVVKDIEVSEHPYLLVDHKPLIGLPRFGKPKYLPVKVAGINITSNGKNLIYKEI